MSRPFNATANLDGLVQCYEKEIGADYGFISGNTSRLKEFVSATRSAWDMYLYLAFNASGTWNYDDSNHTDYPIIKTNLVSGQKDYTFTADELGNLVLDIYKVAVLPSATATEYEEIFPIDQQTSNHGNDLVSETTDTGVPFEYDKTANGFFLTPTPSYNATNGLKVYINREPSYFTTTDTTKKPGCPGIHHDYFYLRPAYDYARRNNLANLGTLREAVEKFEGNEERRFKGSIARYFGRRQRDTKKVLQPKKILYI